MAQPRRSRRATTGGGGGGDRLGRLQCDLQGAMGTAWSGGFIVLSSGVDGMGRVLG